MVAGHAQLFAGRIATRQTRLGIKNRVIQTHVHHGQIVVRAIEAVQIRGRLACNQNQLRARTRVQMPFERNDQAIVNPPMDQARPGAHGISREAQLRPHLPNEFRENDMNRNGVGVETIGSRREHQIVPDFAKRAVPPSPNVIGREPPHKIPEMRSRKFRNPMPGQLCEVQILQQMLCNSSGSPVLSGGRCAIQPVRIPLRRSRSLQQNRLSDAFTRLPSDGISFPPE